MQTKKAVLGLVGNHAQAETIVEDLRLAGISGGDISALFSDRSGSRGFAHEHSTKAPEGAVAGASAGGAIGGALGLLVGIGALVIPGLGPLIAAGPILAMVSGAAAGAAVFGLAGGLIGMGIPEVEAKQYEGKIQEGNILISVHVEDADQRARARKILEHHGATNLVVVGEQGVPSQHHAT
jgi:hypothetical protein